ncbi:hypothetical protein RN001_012066 [Aquatica leii]|uniref:Uncharacterized protein n=1 Tax=Aquatica leii TaxID=1421715 RepID=A0AAN7PSI5_9COLE|nr:hypothetical protein RN001_012066 [Aquatica leii]
MDNENPVISMNETQASLDLSEQRLNKDDDDDFDNTIHGFNITSNTTVLEKPLEVTNDSISNKNASCEGSDSGVEVIENCCLQRALSINSTNSQEFGTVTPAYSYESSIISCCSNYEEAYNILARRNSTLFEDYKLRTCDGTSEGGSESSSIAGSGSSKISKKVNLIQAKKKYGINECKNKNVQNSIQRSRPVLSPKSSTVRPRGKSIDKAQPNKPDILKTPNSKNKAPNNLSLPTIKKDKPTSRASSTTRTPITTPTDDGRWPSINSKPAPLMGRSMRGLFNPEFTPTPKKPPAESKSTALEKYATLPRRRKEKSADNLHDMNKHLTKDSNPNKATVKRQSSTPRSLPPYPRKKSIPKTKIYHEVGMQTALTQTDIEKAFSGIAVNPAQPQDVETCDKDVQVDRNIEELDKLQEQLRILTENYEKLSIDFKTQSQNLVDTKQQLEEEVREKNGLKEELKQNTERVLAIIGNDIVSEEENNSCDSLMMLENRYQKVSQIVIKQENEISELNSYCRTLQKDLEKSFSSQNILLQQQHDLESESIELQEFMQAEKSTLSDALRESENEIKKLHLLLKQKDKELENKQEESKRLVRVSEQRRHENIGLQARLGAMEMRSRELLIYQGSHISGATVALTSLINRLDGLVDELVTSYSISEQDFEDVIFHNEAYTNSSSSPETTPEKSKKIYKEKSPSPKRGSSFVSAIINAIKNATAQTSFLTSKEFSKDTISMDNSDSTEMLDSETEPCLMMEPVLEDVVIPDGHSHNMISSGHGLLGTARLTHSESLNNLSQAILCRQLSEQASLSLTENLSSSFTSEMTSVTEMCPPVSLVDQVIEVDNLITKLLKVLRIIQIENDDCMNELQDDHDLLSDQINKQKDANKIVVQQLKDWENLGAHLKSEITELMQQLSKKHNEIDDLKSDLNQNRKEIERLNEDVCALSTACSKAELELKVKNEETEEAIKNWEGEEVPSKEVLAKVLKDQKEIPLLKETLAEKEKQLNELKREFRNSRHLTENWKEAIGESKKQYEAIDGALEILHSIQTVVQQCPPLAKLQRDLEETSFQTASSLPVTSPNDCNANEALLKSVNNLEIPSPINSTA